MSPYKRGDVYYIDLVIGGRRLVRSTKATAKREARQIEAAVRDLPKSAHRSLVDALHANEVTPREVWLASLDDDLGSLQRDVDDPPLRETLDKKVRQSPYKGVEWTAANIREAAPKHARTSWLNDADHLRDLVSHLRAKGYAAGTEHRRMAWTGKMVRELFGAERRRKLWKVLNLRDEDNRRCAYLSHEEMRALEEIASPEMWVLIQTAAATGLRQGELLDLRVRDIDFDEEEIRVRKGKSEAARRTVPIHGRPLEALRVRCQGREPRGLLWPDLDRNAVYYRFDKYRRALELKTEEGDWFRFHDLRHHFAVHMARAGVPLTELRDYLGHTSLDMVARYAIYLPRKDPERFKRAYRSMGVGNRNPTEAQQMDRQEPRTSREDAG